MGWVVQPGSNAHSKDFCRWKNRRLQGCRYINSFLHFPSSLWQAILRCRVSTWNLPGEALNDEATGCVFMRSCGQLVNALSYNDFPLKYLVPLFPGYHSLLTFLALPARIFPVSCDSFSVSDSLSIDISRFQC